MRILISILIFIVALPAFAGGPFVVEPNGSGHPILWENNTLKYVADAGPLNSKVDNAKALEWISELLGIWKNASLENSASRVIKVSNLKTDFVGTIGSDITSQNYLSIINVHKGEAVIIFDEDGSIVDDQLGIGSNKFVVGFASPVASSSSPYFIGGVVVMNGLFVDGDSEHNGEVEVEEFKAAMLHEIGHLLNLDHTQANIEAVARAFDGDFSTIDEIPTMYPVLYTSDQLNLQTDDIVALAEQYPSDEYLAEFCSFSGSLIDVDGNGFQGADVVARSLELETEWSDVRTIVSGVTYPAGTGNGGYLLGGLVPGRKYVVGYRGLDDIIYTGGSNIAPFDPPRSGILSGIINGEVAACQSGGNVQPTMLNIAKIEIDPNAVNASVSSSDATAPSGGCSLINF